MSSTGGYSSPANAPQAQYGASSSEVAAGIGSNSSGGMRGIGLLLFVIGQISLQKKSSDLAKDYYNTNKLDYDFFNSTYKGPMVATRNEAFAAVPYTHDKYASAPAAAARVANIDRQWYKETRLLSRYAVGAAQRLAYEAAKQRAQLLSANWWLGWKNEYDYALKHNERLFNRKMVVVNMGIGAGNEIARGLAGAQANLSSAYANMGNQFGSIAGGIMEKGGYDKSRNEVRKANGAQ